MVHVEENQYKLKNEQHLNSSVIVPGDKYCIALLGENKTELDNYLCRNDLRTLTKKRTGSKDRGEMSELRASVRHEEAGKCQVSVIGRETKDAM